MQRTESLNEELIDDPEAIEATQLVNIGARWMRRCSFFGVKLRAML